MQCPIDGNDLLIAERNGVEIDYCPKCRGVWLDRGELDKIIERAAAQLPTLQPAPRRDEPATYHRSDYDDDDYPQKRKRGKSFLDDLFDF